MTDEKRAPDGGLNGEVAKPLAATESGLERRRARWVAWEHHELSPVLLEIADPGDGWRPVDCTLVDVGAGGTGLLTAESLAPGSRVRLTFQLPHRLGRDAEADEASELTLAPWSGQGEVVHARHTPERVHEHVPASAHRPHHHGVRFRDLEGDSERRLLSALYGPLPAGWAVERYRINGAQADNGGAPADRYAVLKEGKRVAWGFGTYDRARSRAWSIHMDDVAVARRRAGATTGSGPAPATSGA